MISKLVLVSILCFADATEDADHHGGGIYQKLYKKEVSTGTCGDLRDQYQKAMCCGSPAKATNQQLVPASPQMTINGGSDNTCSGTKPSLKEGAKNQADFENFECMKDGVIQAAEQSGTDVTKGYVGQRETDVEPIKEPYWKVGLCPVNVHWHLGTEHRSEGEFDESGKGPSSHLYEAGESRRLSRRPSNSRHNFSEASGRRLADDVRLGYRCHHYDPTDAKFTTEYNWQYCQDMVVGETYEVHWPHSSMGACHTPNQYQTPFYDGVFCHFPVGIKTGTHDSVGVQGQIFTIVNDESYFYPDLLRGMIVDGVMGAEITYYTGSTTGTSRNNVICSKYTPITWQVDRKCHLISASSFDKMCADMLAQRDDMSGDVYPHGARELVSDSMSADNHHSPRL